MTKRELRHALLSRGYTLSGWAAAHHYKQRIVQSAVDRWMGREGLPQGPLTYRILRDLSKEVGQELVPGILKDAA
jgi:hypothetical protein